MDDKYKIVPSRSEFSSTRASFPYVARLFRTYRGVRFTQFQIYLIFDVLAIQKLTILSVQVWTRTNERKNRLKSPFLYYSRNNICVWLRFITKFQLC